MKSYGFASQWTVTLKVLTEETIKSSAIEGVVLDPESVRFSVAKKLGLDLAELAPQIVKGSKDSWSRLRSF
jgi:hypothetical protein